MRLTKVKRSTIPEPDVFVVFKKNAAIINAISYNYSDFEPVVKIDDAKHGIHHYIHLARTDQYFYSEDAASKFYIHIPVYIFDMIGPISQIRSEESYVYIEKIYEIREENRMMWRVIRPSAIP